MNKASSRETFLKFVKRLLFQNSHLQTKKEKIIRLMKDKSTYIPQTRSSFIEYLSLALFPKFAVFNPVSIGALVFYFFIFFAIIYYITEMGIILTYGEVAWYDELHSPAFIFIDAFTVLIFILDIPISLNSGFLNRGLIVTDRKRIVARYLRQGLIIDVVTVLILIVSPASGALWTNWLKLWLILKLIRLSEIDDFYMRKFNIYRKSKAVYVIFKQIILIFVLSHVVGLIFYAMDYQFYITGYYPPDQCWLISSTAYSPILSLSWPLQYLYTLYWGVNTISTISYGDIAPLNPIETNYSIVSFCFGFIVYGYVVNQIVKIILWARQHTDQFRNEMIIIDTYMESMKISSDLKEQIRNYLQFLHNDELNRDIEVETQLKQKLPQDLRIQLLKSAYAIYYNKIYHIFNDSDAIRFLFHLTQRKYTNNEMIYDQFDKSNSLFYLHKGAVQFLLRVGNKWQILYKTNNSNELFGQYETLKSQPWRCRCLAKGGSLIYSIDRQKMVEQTVNNKELLERMKLIQYQLLCKENVNCIFHFCYLCRGQHDFQHCKENLPIFKGIVYELDTEGKSKRQRYTKPYSCSLKNFKEFNAIANMRNLTNKKLLIKVEKRLAKIKKKMEERNKDFQIDIAHDWSVYEPEWNLSKLKQQWNHK